MSGPYRIAAERPENRPAFGTRRLGVPADVLWDRLRASAASARRPWRGLAAHAGMGAAGGASGGAAGAAHTSGAAASQGDVVVLQPIGPGRAEVRWAPGGSAAIALDVWPAPGGVADVRLRALHRGEGAATGALAMLLGIVLLPTLAVVALLRPWPGLPLVWTATTLLAVLAAASLEAGQRAAAERRHLAELVERWLDNAERP
jgi:hypothetical protein